MAFDSELADRLSDAGKNLLLRHSHFEHTRSFMVGSQPQAVTFRTIDHRGQLQAACELLNERYGWRGYGSTHSIPTSSHHTTFLAEMDGAVVGTLTLAIDSGEGLAIDRTFREEASEARSAAGSHICELTRLAFHPDVRSKEVLAGLFHIVFIYGTTISDCTDLFIEVHPRHAGFYEMMLGFERVGALRTNQSVGVPSQLMRLKVGAIGQSIARLAGDTGARSNRSLYPCFFKADEEVQIRRSLAMHQKMRLLLGNDGCADSEVDGPGSAEPAACAAPNRPSNLQFLHKDRGSAPSRRTRRAA